MYPCNSSQRQIAALFPIKLWVSFRCHSQQEISVWDMAVFSNEHVEVFNQNALGRFAFPYFISNTVWKSQCNTVLFLLFCFFFNFTKFPSDGFLNVLGNVVYNFYLLLIPLHDGSFKALLYFTWNGISSLRFLLFLEEPWWVMFTF